MVFQRLGDSEYRFMQLIWERAPISSGELVKLAQERLGWKKSTTYTVIKHLSEKGYVKNENATVQVLIPKEKAQQEEAQVFMERAFEGSLPKFLTAFFGGKKISDEQAEEIKKMIDSYKK